MKIPRLFLVGALATAGALFPSAPSHAATAIGTCAGPVLAQTNSITGDWAAAPVAYECSDTLSNRLGAYGTFSGTSFSGTYYDGVCSGSVHGTKVGTELVGFVSVTCNGVARSGPFSLTVADLVGTLSVTR